MDYSMIYNMYSDAISSGKLDVLKMFFDTFKNHPILAAFYTCLILRKPAKAAAEFINRFA